MTKRANETASEIHVNVPRVFYLSVESKINSWKVYAASMLKLSLQFQKYSLLTIKTLRDCL